MANGQFCHCFLMVYPLSLVAFSSFILSFMYPCYHLQSLTILPLVSLPSNSHCLLHISSLPFPNPFFSPSSIILSMLPFFPACTVSSSSSFPPWLCPLYLCSVVIIPPPSHLTADNHPRRKRKKAEFLSAATAAIHCRVVNERDRLIATPSLSPYLLFFLSSSFCQCCLLQLVLSEG